MAVARALAARPDIVFADEPTGNLDPATAERMLDVLLYFVGFQAAIFGADVRKIVPRLFVSFAIPIL